MLSAFVLAFAVLPRALAGVSEVWWNITYVDNVNPDGLFPRRVVGINGSWPPPPLDVSTEDTFILHATNSLDEVATLHHHGMFFNNMSWYDGALQITQCGIPPGESFDYFVPMNSSGQRGTYWIHAHDKDHYVDGLRAPLVLHPPNGTEVYTYDDEFTVIVSDWYHEQHATLLKRFNSIANPGGAEPIPDSPLIYFAHNGQYRSGFNENATLPFEPGKTYRLRIVNMGAFAMFFVWIEGHQMRIIEVDGTDVQEAPVNTLSLSVAQRYSVLVTARNDTNTNWAFHANMDTAMFDRVPANLNPNATASITYNTSALLQSPGTVDQYVSTNDTALVPVNVQAQLPAAGRTIPLLVSFNTMSDGTNRAMFNNITFNQPVVPMIFSVLSLDSVAGQGASSVAGAYGPWSYILNAGDTVDLVVMNSDVGKHPFHLHGHKFQIIHRATTFTSNDPSLNPPLQEGQSNPIRRDTVMIDGGGSATLRFVADNPGAWLFHCHIEWHLVAGLAITLVAAPTEVVSLASLSSPTNTNTTALAPPQFMYSQCASLHVPTTGNAAGHNSTTDLRGLTIGPFLQNNGWHPRGIGAMAGCVMTVLLGFGAVTWYSLGERLTDAEVEAETRRRAEEREEKRRGRFFYGGLARKFVR